MLQPGGPAGGPPPYRPKPDKLQLLVASLELTYTPYVVLTGVICNLLLLLFIGLTKELRKRASVHYIIAIVCADTVLLLNTGLIWLNNIGHRYLAICYITLT